VCLALPQPEWVKRVWYDGQTVLDKILQLYDVDFVLGYSAPDVRHLLGGIYQSITQIIKMYTDP